MKLFSDDIPTSKFSFRNSVETVYNRSPLLLILLVSYDRPSASSSASSAQSAI